MANGGLLRGAWARLAIGAGMLLLAACHNGESGLSPPLVDLPPDPKDWACVEPVVTPDQTKAWCDAHPPSGDEAVLPEPSTIANLDAKNVFDLELRDFLRGGGYKSWTADLSWRLTGPYVGDFDTGQSLGVHPAVRVWYSPKMVKWMCGARSGNPEDGAMIVKEMHAIKAEDLGIDKSADCMSIKTAPDQIQPGSWTVMYRKGPGNGNNPRDGWYWANPTASGDGNPPIYDMSAYTDPAFFSAMPGQDNPAWYPTGDLFDPTTKPADIVTPYSEYGALCLNCHTTASQSFTFASLDNVLSNGIQYRHFRGQTIQACGHASGNVHPNVMPVGLCALPPWNFSRPLSAAAGGFDAYYSDKDTVSPIAFSDALALRLPAETYDHQVSDPTYPGLQWLTSDQCVSCHDATTSNDSVPNMQISDPQGGTQIDVSPYGEWRSSPMGLAGRDPIFFSQLQSETNQNIPGNKSCIENTCLHCHGAMGQRQFAADTASSGQECKSLFPVTPPSGVAFGQAFTLDKVTAWQDAAGAPAKYGDLARDGISCMVCHSMKSDDLGTEAANTGNFSSTAASLYGPYADDTVAATPMKTLLGTPPQFGAHMTDSEVCSTCHNILLPIFDRSGKPLPVPGPDPGTTLAGTYEQSTGLEWNNSQYSRPGTFKSCQDCHMPTQFHGKDLAGTRIANIESDDFPPTTGRDPDADIHLTPRDKFSRHSLHGLNLFLNQIFQQQPLLLGLRQIDYAVKGSVQPALLTTAQSMTEMASGETADLQLGDVVLDGSHVQATVTVHNKTGHYLPSGVGFRRLFIEFVAADASGNPVRASGRSNALGVILNGTGDTPLPSEAVPSIGVYQPHYQTVTSGDQAQIFEEVIEDEDQLINTWFLRRVQTVKDNRLRPLGFDPQVFLADKSPYVRLLGKLEGTAGDPHYSDPAQTGSAQVIYNFALDPGEAAKIATVTARLYSQSIPPHYLKERFRDGVVGAADKQHIQRLYYLTSHLNTGADTGIGDWKLQVASDCRTAGGSACAAP
jgi:hypothetical protein